MGTSIREHAGTGLVAAAVIAAALADGVFDATAYAATSIVVWAAVIAGLGSRALPASRIATTAAVAGLCLAGITALAAASVAWASDQGRAFEEAVRASAYLGLFVLAACTASAEGRARWIDGLAAGLGIVAALAVLSHLQPGLLESAELDELIPGAAGRASYPVGYWNGLAALLAVAAVFLAHVGRAAPLRWQRSLAVAVVPIALLGIWLTSSRGGATAAVLGLAALAALSPNRSRQVVVLAVSAVAAALLIGAAEALGSLSEAASDAARSADGDRMTAIVAVVAIGSGAAAWALDAWRPRIAIPMRWGLAAAAVAALAVVALSDPGRRFDEFTAPPEAVGPENGIEPGLGSDLSSSGRWQFWGEALDAFESAPVAGIGAGAFEDWWSRNGSLPVFVRNPHSLPLQQAAELGLVGLLLSIGFLAAVALAARTRLADGPGEGNDEDGDAGVLIAVVLAGCICAAIDWTWAIPAVFGPVVIAAALLTARGRMPPRNAYYLGVASVAFAWVAMIGGGLVVLTELKLEQSRTAAGEGRYGEAVERAEEAHTVQPWSPEPYTQLALLAELSGDYAEGLDDIREAESRDAEDWRLLQIEARLLLGMGDDAGAARLVRKAQELYPLVPSVNPRGAQETK